MTKNGNLRKELNLFNGVALVSGIMVGSGIFIVSEEMKSPRKDLPKAIIIGVLLVTLLYMLFNVAPLKILSPEKIAATEAPAALAAQTLLGGAGGVIVAIGALLAILASCNGCVLANPREIYVMARDKRFFRPLAYVSPKSGTPSMPSLR